MGREHNDAVKELAQRRTVPLPPRGRCYHASSLFPAATKVFHDFFGLLHAKSGTASCAGGTGKQFLVRDTLHVVAQYLFRERLCFLMLLAGKGNQVFPKFLTNHYCRQERPPFPGRGTLKLT